MVSTNRRKLLVTKTPRDPAHEMVPTCPSDRKLYVEYIGPGQITSLQGKAGGGGGGGGWGGGGFFFKGTGKSSRSGKEERSTAKERQTELTLQRVPTRPKAATLLNLTY